jgi:hypothetical protein
MWITLSRLQKIEQVASLHNKETEHKSAECLAIWLFVLAYKEPIRSLWQQVVVVQDEEVVKVGEVVEGLELILVLVLVLVLVRLRLHIHRIMRLLLRPIVLKILQLHKHDNN